MMWVSTILLARVCDEALLFKGDDFAHTDIEAAGASR